MTQVISVKFNNAGRSYYFDPGDIDFKVGDMAVVETANGMACVNVTKENHTVQDEEVVSPLKKVIRKADENDLKTVSQNKEKELSAAAVCEEKILAHDLKMKLVRAEYSFDRSKITFFFTADGRVDFRELVKDLASYFHTRIELRQIGVRDEARMLGGIGICGREYCCKGFLNDFEPVSIKMAKEQNLSLNPTKISGSCGRLMCCLKYEQNAYDYLIKVTPGVGAKVKAPEGIGTVTDVNFITGNLTVKPDTDEGIPFKTHRDRVKILSRGKRSKSDDELAAELKNLE
ncbi:MAG: stage 0 sporulation family protein [Clostridia bacterium]|nr:stage 0 sporulation family protein [Clostridia bacterium]MBR3144397.1 stage 0 sporulation family protein [Clostridia bacterium]